MTYSVTPEPIKPKLPGTVCLATDADHLIAAVAVWAGYGLLLGVKKVRGLTGRRLSLSAVVLFVLSLAVFAFV